MQDEVMSITRPPARAQGFHGDDAGVTRWWDGAKWTPKLDQDEEIVPESMKRERLEAQIRSFMRAGYRLETQTGLQAVVRRAGRSPMRRDAVLLVATAGLWLIPMLRSGRRAHRVVITVDHLGSVRLA